VRETPNRCDADVAIIGAGPVGLTLALLLARNGCSVLLFERHAKPFAEPRAVGIDDETLRTWQACGVLESLAPYMLEGPDGAIVFTYRDGKGKGFFSLVQNRGNLGHPEGAVFLQPPTEEALRTALANEPNVRLLVGHEVEQFTQTSTETQTHGRTLDGASFSYSAHYLVGCDGARSQVREQAGIAFPGIDCPESWLILDVLDAEWHEGFTLEQGVEVWCEPGQTSVSVPLPCGYRRWELLLNNAEIERLVQDDEPIRKRIARYRPQDRPTIIRRKEIRFSARQAERYRAGRMLIAGDAAHVTPPFAAQGLVSGIRDAANLAWKLIAVLEKRQPDILLDTYDVERRPHQRKMIDLALSLGRVMMPRTHLEAFIVRSFLRLIQALPARIKGCFVLRGGHLQPHLKAGCFGSGGGSYFPQNDVLDATGRAVPFDALLGTGFAVVNFSADKQEAVFPAALQSFLSKGTPHLQLGRDFSDPDNAYAAFADETVLIRPDRIIHTRLHSTN
jgi:3-(3-hydroxy-phenyl)propionate hydroxylase